MKATAIAPANIALIKYWGKKDEKLRLPLNSSISMNLSECLTTTTVEFSEKFKADEVFLSGESQSLDKKSHVRQFVKEEGKDIARVIKHLERIRKIAGLNLKAKVVSYNNFPTKAGVASSASGFAALTLASSKAAGLNLSEKKLSIMARIGSGSACRSIPDGFVEWKEGDSNESSFAHSLYPADWWDIRDLLLIVSVGEKKVGSTAGMEKAWTSPFLKARLANIKNKIAKIKKALKEKDFTLLGETVEEEAINFHAVMMTQKPALFYWQAETIKIIRAVADFRSQGLMVYLTIDAGPNVHLFCQAKDLEKVKDKTKDISGISKIIVNKPAEGARLVKEHLF
jgi:diphosphomevalonate decarboxylase